MPSSGLLKYIEFDLQIICFSLEANKTIFWKVRDSDFINNRFLAKYC